MFVKKSYTGVKNIDIMEYIKIMAVIDIHIKISRFATI